MDAIKKLVAVYPVCVSIAVAVFFIITVLPIILGVTGCRLWRESYNA